VALIVQSVGMAANPGVMDAIREGLANGGLSEATQGATDAMGSTLLVVATMAGAVAGPLVFLIYRKKRFFGDLALPARERLTPAIFLFFLLGTQAVQCVYGYVITFIDYLLKPTGVSVEGNYSGIIDQIMFNPLGLVYVIIVGPIFEELVFRGALLGSLRKYGENFAILLSSLIFGFFHMVVLQIPFGFFVGLLLGYVASRYSLRASIALHMIVNGLSALLSQPNLIKADAVIASLGIADIALIACTVVFVIWVIVKRQGVSARVRAGAAYYDGTYRIGFSSIPLWFYLILTGFVGVMQLIFLPGAI